MGKYEALAKEIIKQVGGKENIVSVTHCFTRLRFQLADDKKASDDTLKKTEGIVTVMRSGGQYQVVIGNHVADVYKDVCAASGFSPDKDTSDQEEKDLTLFGRLIDIMSGVMMPFLTIMSACGILKGVNALLSFAGLYQKTDGIYVIFNAIGDSVFYFLPIILGFNSAKKFKCDTYMGMIIGAFLCYPAINNTDITLFGHVFHTSYTSSVLPVILMVAIAAPLERFFKKILPDVVKALLAPAFVMAIVLPLGFVIVGPSANWVSQQIAAVMQGIYDINPLIAGLVIGGLYQIMVIFGVHSILILSCIMNVLNGNIDPIGPLNFGQPFVQASVVLAVWCKTNDQKLKDIALPAWISALVAGITEPAIYGVTLPRKRLFVGSCVAAAISGFTSALLGLTRYTMAGSSLLYIPGLMNPDNPVKGLVSGLIVFAVAMISGFTIGYILFQDDESVTKPVKKATAKAASKEIASPVSGTVIPLKQVKDTVFSSGVLGQGIAVLPDQGLVSAPFDGTVTALFPTNHAIGLTSPDGIEVLIHIGMDTVQLEGKHFQAHVAQGDTVKKGQLLVSFDKQAIEKAGYCLETPVLITNQGDFTQMLDTPKHHVAQGDTLITLKA